ncbi:hypothetical protein [Zavarzinia sp.]|uniref:hypothetical protein n=1 Tax=Zavarzinia sp. TaxID=2027920 RepID=UPI00356250BA
MNSDLWLYFVTTNWPPLAPTWMLVGLGGGIGIRLIRWPRLLGRFGFAGIALPIFLAAAASNYLVADFPDAFLAGRLWLPMAVWTFAIFVLAVAFGAAAGARARDAFQRSWPAALALIPVAGVALFLWPSRVERGARLPDAVQGPFGILSSLAFVAVTVLFGYTGSTVQHDVSLRVQSELDFQIANMRLNVQLRGLHAVMDDIAHSIHGPIPVDTVTTLVEVRAEDSRLRFDYSVSAPPGAVDREHLAKRVHDDNCRDRSIRALMDLGATIERHYYSTEGLTDLTFATTIADCVENL